jgi:hypothetical protein
MSRKFRGYRLFKGALTMKSISGITAMSLLALTTLTLGLQCFARVSKVNTDDLMDIVLDMKKAAAAADKLVPDGSRNGKSRSSRSSRESFQEQ